MHFAYPPRKSSNPPPFRPRSSRLPLLRRGRLRTGLILLGVALLGLFLLTRGGGGSGGGTYHEHLPSGSPPVVIVTVYEPKLHSAEYIKSLKENRELYAKRHGYEAFVVKMTDYNTQGSPLSWSKPMAMRHAISKFPDAAYLWFLDQHALILDPSKSLEERFLAPKKLEGMMKKDFPVVPPDSIIKTFSHLRGEDADIIVSQDKDGLVSDSLVVRNGDWGKFFVETWFAPLYRSYNFQRAEKHALEHIVQWHPTILSKLALVPQRTMASYTRMDLGDTYQDGDFVVMFAGCLAKSYEGCEKDAEPYMQVWRQAFAAQ